MLSEAVKMEIERRASMRGQSPETFLFDLLKKDTSAALDPETVQDLENWRQAVCRSGSASGRNGQPWREWLHEGHER